MAQGGHVFYTLPNPFRWDRDSRDPAFAESVAYPLTRSFVNVTVVINNIVNVRGAPGAVLNIDQAASSTVNVGVDQPNSVPYASVPLYHVPMVQIAR